jgi:hypothetical protein
MQQIDTQRISFLINCLSLTILKAWTLQTHTINASGLPEFNSSNLQFATFYKTQLLLVVFQDSILQKYDTISLGNHIWAF